jgi:hypothetical protein
MMRVSSWRERADRNHHYTTTHNYYTSSIKNCNDLCGGDIKCDYTSFKKNAECILYSQGPLSAWNGNNPGATCGCEVNGWEFCNHDSWGRSCEACPETKADCDYMGLPSQGVADCKKRCDPPQWIADDDYVLSEKWGESCGALTATTGEEACEGHGHSYDECWAHGCCHWDNSDQDCFSSVQNNKCTGDLFTSGEMACERHGHGEATCLALGCCYWTGFQCMSDVFTQKCPGVDFRRQDDACGRVTGNWNCGRIGCCNYDWGSHTCRPQGNAADICLNPLSTGRQSDNVQHGGTLPEPSVPVSCSLGCPPEPLARAPNHLSATVLCLHARMRMAAIRASALTADALR